jgi:hypothetical protein
MSVRSARYNRLGLRTPKGTSALPRERDAWAFLDAAGITSSRQQEAVIQLVRDLKQARLWTKMKAIYPFVGGTASSHKWNLKDARDVDAAFRLTFSGGWTHSSNGALPNGTNAYADTNMIATTLSNSSTCVSIYSRTNSNGLYFDIGASNQGSTQLISIYSRHSGNAISDSGSYLVSRISATTADSLGSLISSRTASNVFRLYKNGAQIGSSTNNDTNGMPSSNILLSAVFVPLSGYTQYSNRQLAFATIGDGLTDSEATLLYNCVDRYQKFLGRAV